MSARPDCARLLLRHGSDPCPRTLGTEETNAILAREAAAGIK
jgi:hypothetical protein